MVEDEGRQRRIRRSVAEKLQILAAARAPGASVARVARENGVNANQVYAWQRQVSAGRLATAGGSQALLAVRLAGGMPRRAPGTGGLELESGRGRLRIETGADPALLRIVLEHLIG